MPRVFKVLKLDTIRKKETVRNSFKGNVGETSERDGVERI